MLNSLNPTLSLQKTKFLELNPAIEKQFLTGGMAMSIETAMEEMVRLRSHCDLVVQGEMVFRSPNCLVVTQDEKLCGLFTERELVQLIAEGADLTHLTLGEVIQIPAIALSENADANIFTALDLLSHHKLRHLPIVDAGDRPVGIVTYDSLRRALPPINLLTHLHCLADVMATEIVSAPPDASLLEVAQLMTKHQVSCVVICTGTASQRQPIGIVTQRDIVQFHSLDLALGDTTAATVMSSPLFTMPPTASIWEAHQTMNQQRLRRLIILNDQQQMVGLVSQTSLFQVLRPNDMYKMIDLLHHAVDQRTQELEEKNKQLEKEIGDRQKAEIQLQQAHDHLKELVKERTHQLHEANAKLKADLRKREEMTAELEKALKDLQHTQLQLIQTEKMSGLGQLVAGIAHEINNPINFIYGNLQHAGEYIEDIIEIINLYEKYYPDPPQEIRTLKKVNDLEFIREDVKQLVASMHAGVDRIRNLILSLKTFSRLDESKFKVADIHQGIDSTLLLIQNRLQEHHHVQNIRVVREYETIPKIECYPGQLNQVFLNLLLNAVDAIEEAQQRGHYCSIEMLMPHQIGGEVVEPDCPTPLIRIQTSISPEGDRLLIRIKDNGIGISPEIQSKLFDPFFTTKPVGKGTGLGLSISYQVIVENHSGTLECNSSPDQGTEFVITLPVHQAAIAQ